MTKNIGRGKKIYCNQGGEVTCKRRGAQGFFSLREGGCARFMLFLLSSQHVSPSSHCVPISPSLYPILFALSSTLENLYTQPKGRYYNIFILGLFKA